jgi:type IV pilus assembly protein PilQ
MTTMIDNPATPSSRARRALTLLLTAQLVAGSTSPAWAQRRRAEPEANPSFQQSIQTGGGAGSGSPLDPEAPAGEGGGSSGRSMQGVQIGTSLPKAAAPERVAPLDARVTVRVKGAPLATFLDTISAQAKVNFIITEGLETKRVTAFLQNVTVREALQVLLEIKGLTYQQIGKSNTYVVTPRSKAIENLITRIYTLSYVPLIPLGTANSEQSAITPRSSNSGGAQTGGGGGQGNSASPTPGGGAANSEIAIVNVLQSILSKSGKVSVEPRTNALIVTDIPEVFPQVEQIIAELDKKSPQVIIEAQIVEIDSTRSKDLGIEWGGARGELASFTGGQRDTSFPMALPTDLSRTRFLDPLGPGSIISAVGSNSASASAGSGSGATTVSQLVGQSFVKTSVLDLTALQITLRALVSRSEARFLGKPKILTLNNKTAIIQIAQNQATSVSQQLQSAGGGGVSQAGNSIERTETGLILRVTPQVNKDGYITMFVQPTFTDVQASSLSTAQTKVFDAISRGASTLVRVKNGQTLVLGGLLQSTETKVVRKVPFLGYIPLIGWLFTSLQNDRRNSDLVIFITPTVVSD